MALVEFINPDSSLNGCPDEELPGRLSVRCVSSSIQGSDMLLSPCAVVPKFLSGSPCPTERRSAKLTCFSDVLGFLGVPLS